MDTAELATTPELAGEPELVLIGGGCLVRANLLEDRATHFFDWLLSDFDAVVHFFEHIDDDDAFGPAAWTLDDVRARQHARLGMYRKVEHRQLTLVSLHDFLAHRGAPADQLEAFVARYARRRERLVALLERSRAVALVHVPFAPRELLLDADARERVPSERDVARLLAVLAARFPRCACTVHVALRPAVARAVARGEAPPCPPNARAHALTAVGRPDGDAEWKEAELDWDALFARARGKPSTGPPPPRGPDRKSVV